MIPLKAFQLALVHDEIVISSPRSRLKKATVAITEAMFAIYSLSGKVAQHRQTSPWSLIGSHLDLLLRGILRIRGSLENWQVNRRFR